MITSHWLLWAKAFLLMSCRTTSIIRLNLQAGLLLWSVKCTGWDKRLEISQCHITHRINYWSVFAIWNIFLIKERKELFWLTSSLAKSTDSSFIQFVGLLVNCWSCTSHKVQFWPSNILGVTSHNSKSSPSNRVRYIIANHLFPWHNLQADYS